jgi:hypothetical protein
MTDTPTADPGRETRLVDLKGREIVVRELKDAQQLLIQREAQILQREDVGKERKVVAVGRIYDILESAVVQPGDLDYVTKLNVAGDLEMKDLMAFVTVFGQEEKPKVRRGRPPIKRA